ncbi:hypothetical protein C2E21_1569 [Chlorella sorokiniana]|uniref:R3H domain-containing protein n=1 Tax=Chlorella sorokiniana TaxID=3076 RepID=A0A2P6U142_CHLSO|nr:hypothetical protein C2E21_1569 [Chlorella sorokiniana]|eukprot:PRW60034.1 hypothetical protein C2E21_1569 [Chlorella sorokiniana]
MGRASLGAAWAPLALAALLAVHSAGPAAAGLVATDSYSCDPATCRPPACLCPSNSPPGGLPLAQVPQFVLISHDNALDELPYELMMRVLGDKTQPNGCPVPVTWFAMRYHSNCENGQAALARGDEVAMQANRFVPDDPFTAPVDPNPNYNNVDPATGKPSLEIEITMSRKWWNEVCGLPLKDMVGFRAQEYYNNPAIRQTLSKAGWLYDATIPESWYPNSPTSPAANEILWPYTMDAGIPQDCGYLGPTIGKCSAGERYAGLWEVPLWTLQVGGTNYGLSDYGNTETEGIPPVDDMAQLLKDALDQRLQGGRSPLQLSTFYEWLGAKPPSDCATDADPYCFQYKRELSEGAKALQQLIDYAADKPEVRFVTYSDLIRWMQDPVPLDRFDAWQQCKVTGVKADLTAVNLTAADKAGAFYLTQKKGAGGAGPAGAAGAPSPAPADGQAEAEAGTEAEAPASLPMAQLPGGLTTAAAPSPTAELDEAVELPAVEQLAPAPAPERPWPHRATARKNPSAAMMTEPSHEKSAWASLGGPLSDVLCCVAAASDAPAHELATCSLVCKGWHAVLKGDAPWAAALRRQFGYEAQSAEERRAGCRQLMIQALTGRLYLTGQCPAGLGCSPAGARFTAPERLLLCSADSDSQPVSLQAAAAGPRSLPAGLGRSISIKAVAAGADFAVLLTWDGSVLDTRCLASCVASPQRQQQGGSLDWSGLWRPPPGCRPLAVAAGGCWQGSGRAGGHVLVVTDQHTVWGWGANAAGQLGTGCISTQRSSQPSVEDAQPVASVPSWAAAPLEVADSAAATAMGFPVAACCGDEHSALLCRSGQAAMGRQGGCCYLLADVGPSAAWHGMHRTNQLAGGGGGDAANRAAAVVCGSGSLYALTSSGEVFSWGQGGQGELGLGGNSKNVCTPSRLPWAHDVAAVAASSGGRLAAVVDRGGRLLTFGAGKAGCLGHGDTAKKAVGRPVKALAGHTVYSAAGGTEWMLVLAGWRPPAGRGGKGGGGKGATVTSPRAAQLEVDPPPAGQEADAASGFRYLAVEPPSPRSEGALSPGSMPSTPLARRRSSGSGLGAEVDATSTASGSIGGWPGLRGRSGREQRKEEKERLGRSGRRQQGGEGERLDLAPEAAYSRRQRWMRDPPVSASPITPPESGSEEGSGGEASGGGTPRSRGSNGGRGGRGGSGDHHMAYLLRRQLKAFSSDPRQRQLVFPAEFSSRDRWQVHLMAEARGLMHESVGESGARRLVVWKPSRSRRSLKPSMLQGAVSDGDDGSGGTAAQVASGQQ